MLNDPYKHATSPILFCTINSVFSAIISGKLFLSVNITSESCLHEKSPVVFKILVLSRALLGAGPGRAVAPHHGDRDTHTHQPPPSMAIMLQNKHHAISIHFCPSFNHLSHIFSDLCLLYSWSSIIYSSAVGLQTSGSLILGLETVGGGWGWRPRDHNYHCSWWIIWEVERKQFDL